MQPTALTIVVASTRPGRVGAPVGRWVTERAEARHDLAVTVVDLAELALPFLDEPNHPRLGQYTKDHTKAWSATVAASEAFVFVTPEYNYGYPATLKNALDYLHAEWRHKPVGLVSYGGVAAGTRSVQQLKPVLQALSLTAVGEAVAIPFVHSHVKDGTFVSDEPLDEAVEAMFDSLVRWAEVLEPLRRSA
jgi:NAD(P)H-dependent FMN reductase